MLINLSDGPLLCSGHVARWVNKSVASKKKKKKKNSGSGDPA